MQAISKGKQVQMIGALLQLEDLLNHEQHDCSCAKQSADYREKLEAIHHNYEQLLQKLAEQISAYEVLFGYVKVHFLGKKLKELKKDIPADRVASIPALIMLHNNIQLAYGT